MANLNDNTNNKDVVVGQNSLVETCFDPSKIVAPSVEKVENTPTNVSNEENGINGLDRLSSAKRLVERLGTTIVVTQPDQPIKNQPIQTSVFNQFYNVFSLLEQSKIPIEWFVENVVPRCGIVLISGKRKGFKTWFAMDLALHIASGRTHAMGKTKPVKVLYLDYENGHVVFSKRFFSLFANFTEEEQTKICQHFSYIENPYAIIQSVNSKNGLESGDERFRNIIGTYEPDIVFIDTLRRGINDDENKADVINMVYKMLKVCQQERGTTFVLLHHFRKEDAKNKETDALDAIRGSGDLTAMAGVILSVTRLKTTSQFIVNVSANRFHEEEEGFKFSLESDDGVSRVDFVERIVAGQTEPERASEELLNYLYVNFSSGSFRHKDMTSFLNSAGYSKTSAKEAVNKLIESSNIVKLDSSSKKSPYRLSKNKLSSWGVGV